jgi:predicted nucleotidyltransferase
MLSKLFGSDARVRILSLFTLNAGREFYLREIAQRTGLAVRSVQRTVQDLTDIDILHRERRGNSVYFWLNAANPIVPELKAIFVKTVGLGDLLRSLLDGESRIDEAFVYGSVAKDEETAGSDVDLAVIGRISPVRLQTILTDLEEATAREINATVFTPREWRTRVRAGEHFAATLLREHKIMLIGHASDLEDPGERADG